MVYSIPSLIIRLRDRGNEEYAGDGEYQYIRTEDLEDLLDIIIDKGNIKYSIKALFELFPES